MDKAGIYAISIIAIPPNSRADVPVGQSAGLVVARSQEEAEARGFRIAGERYPEEKGYGHYLCHAAEMKREVITQMLDIVDVDNIGDDEFEEVSGKDCF